MKKYLCLMLVASFPSMACADTLPNFTLKGSFAGPYGFVSPGYSAATTSDNHVTGLVIPFAFTTVFSSHSAASSSNFNGAFGLGYSGVLMQSYVLGLETRANIANTSLVINTRSTELNSRLLYKTHLDVRLNKELSLLFKMGLIFEQNTLFYGLIGPVWGSFDLASSDTYSQNLGIQIDAAVQNYRSHYQPGILLGLGLERVITPNIHAGFEYTYSNYGQLNYPKTTSGIFAFNGVPNPATRLTSIHQFNARNQAVFVKLDYYFFSSN